MANLTPTRIFDGPKSIKSLCVTRSGACAVVADELIGIPGIGTVTKRISVPGVGVTSSCIIRPNRNFDLPCSILFSTENPHEPKLNLWNGESDTWKSVETVGKIMSICQGDNYIFVGMEKLLAIYKHTTTGISFLKSTKLPEDPLRMWSHPMGMHHWVNIEGANQTYFTVCFDDPEEREHLFEPQKSAPFAALYHDIHTKIIPQSENGEVHVKMGFATTTYSLGPIRDFAVWSKGLILLLESKEVIITSPAEGLGDSKLWLRLNDRPYSQVAVCENTLLLVSGCSVFEYPLPS